MSEEKICPMVDGPCIGEKCTFWGYLFSVLVVDENTKSQAYEPVNGCRLVREKNP